MAELAPCPHPTGLPFPSQGTLYDRAGLEVDATAYVWKLNHPVRRHHLNFHQLEIRSASMLNTVARYIGEKLATSSTDNTRATFETLTFLKKSAHFQSAQDSGATIDDRLIAELRQVPKFLRWRLHYVRDWYRWCTRQGLPQFSEEVLDRLEDLRIGGNETGRAVRTRDPQQGAFDELEFIALTTRLRATGLDLLSEQEYALCWLATALGCNPLAFALAREEDYKPLRESGTQRIYSRLDIARIKKGDATFRAQFHPKMLNEEIGAAVARLIAANRALRTTSGWPAGCAFPLFRRTAVDESLLGGPHHGFAMHMRVDEITKTIKTAIARLGIISHRTGKPLVVNTRRFRRTYGTRAVEEGASPSELAVMLDHSDLGSVQAYFETRSSQVSRLDAAVALKLAPIADALMGRVVNSERDAVNGDNPAKRIPWYRRHPDRPPEKNGHLGTCGSGPCGLFAPISCYTCPKFQAWRDAPHREVLDWLCAERERKQQAGLDPQIVGLHDATILAVAQVVTTCEGGSS